MAAGELEAIETEIDAIVDDAQHSPKLSPGPTPRRRPGSCSTNPVPCSTTFSQLSTRGNGRLPDTREITFMQATLEALAEEMARDPSIFVLGEGIGKRGGNFKTTAGLYELYGPVRLCDTPICERGFVGLAAEPP